MIAADRRLIHSNQATNLDSIHALEALHLTSLSGPNFKLPYKFENISATNKQKELPKLMKLTAKRPICEEINGLCPTAKK